MKRLFLTLILAITILPLSAENAWTIYNVPNTRTQSNYIHVSDPDNYLSDEAEMKINTALNTIRDSADVFLVCLSTIGYEEPTDFRTRLFNYWGIGDKGKDNGLLLLFVEDAHAFEFETGYGIEPVMTDAKCFEIFQHTIKPYFQKDDYEGGMYAGVMDIVNVFGGTMPEELITVLPDKQVYSDIKAEKDKEVMSSFYIWMVVLLVFCVPIISFLYFLFTRKDDKIYKNKADKSFKDEYTITSKDGLKFINDPGTSWSGSAWQGAGCARSLSFGLSAIVWFLVAYIVFFALMEGEEEIVIRNWIGGFTIFAYFSWICIKQNRRELKMADKVAKESINPRGVYDKAKNYHRTQWVNILAFWMGWYFKSMYEERKKKCPEMVCPECHADMTTDATVQLPAMETAEMLNQARQFTTMHCANGHTFVIKEKGKKYKSFTNCDHCGAHLLKKENTKVIKVATYDHTGLDEVTYGCLFCKEKTVKQVVIPRREHSSSGGGYSSGGGSSHSSGGSFGGGRSGGGGYSGRW